MRDLMDECLHACPVSETEVWNLACSPSTISGEAAVEARVSLLFTLLAVGGFLWASR